MPSPQRLQTAVPLDQQSVLPTVRGVPWWGAVLLATGITGLGAVIDASGSDSLGSIYKFCYLVGCVLAALAVRRRALFTAAAQPPLVAFFISIVALYVANSNASSGLKGFIFNVLLPIASEFPWMATTFVVTLGMVLARWFLTRDAAEDTNRPRSRRTDRTAVEKADGRADTTTERRTPSTTPRRRASDRAKKVERGEKVERAGRTEKVERAGGTDKVERADKTEKVQKVTDDLPPGWTPTRPTVADLRAPDLTPSDPAPSTPTEAGVPDTRPAGT